MLKEPPDLISGAPSLVCFRGPYFTDGFYGRATALHMVEGALRAPSTMYFTDSRASPGGPLDAPGGPLDAPGGGEVQETYAH